MVVDSAESRAEKKVTKILKKQIAECASYILIHEQEDDPMRTKFSRAYDSSDMEWGGALWEGREAPEEVEGCYVKTREGALPSASSWHR